MSDPIYYERRLIASAHYFIYREGKLPGRPNDIFLRFETTQDLANFKSLKPTEVINYDGNPMTVQEFNAEIMPKVRDIATPQGIKHITKNVNDVPLLDECVN